MRCACPQLIIIRPRNALAGLRARAYRLTAHDVLLGMVRQYTRFGYVGYRALARIGDNINKFSCIFNILPLI